MAFTYRPSEQAEQCIQQIIQERSMKKSEIVNMCVENHSLYYNQIVDLRSRLKESESKLSKLVDLFREKYVIEDMIEFVLREEHGVGRR